jgi:putative inorganic carbon (hco3(-)) transporter
VEPFVLLAALYFFWYPSSFPAKNATSGIERGEWLWLLALIIPIIIIYFLANNRIRLQSLRQAPTLILIPMAYGVLFVNVFIYDGISTDIDRADYIPLLTVLTPVMLLRLIVYKRLWTRTPLDVFMLAFILACVFNVESAPHTRGLNMIARPLLGIWLVIYSTELARTTKKISGVLWIMLSLSLLLGLMSIGATQWLDKWGDFKWIISRLPRIELFFAPGGFNPNEIAGALTWLVPLMGGLVFYKYNTDDKENNLSITFYNYTWRVLTTIAFCMLSTGLLLGQSRSAILGVVASTIIIIAVIAIKRIVKKRFSSRWGYVTLGTMILSLLLLLSVSLYPKLESSFDSEDSVAHRQAIWNYALSVIGDHPLTGVGMGHFRYMANNDAEVAAFNLFVPHAHNELIQIATDLGLPGLLFFIGINAATAYMLWICWKQGSGNDQILVTAVGGGLLAHAIYGIGDAIPIWDRFSFIYWLMIAFVAAQYTLTRQQSDLVENNVQHL